MRRSSSASSRTKTTKQQEVRETPVPKGAGVFSLLGCGSGEEGKNSRTWRQLQVYNFQTTSAHGMCLPKRGYCVITDEGVSCVFPTREGDAMREFSLVDADGRGFIGYKEDGSTVRVEICPNYEADDCHKFRTPDQMLCLACRCDCQASPELIGKVLQMRRQSLTQ